MIYLKKNKHICLIIILFQNDNKYNNNIFEEHFKGRHWLKISKI